MPYRPWLRSVLDFITDSTNPYLNFFRRFVPRIGGSGFALDLSPIVAIVVLAVAQALLVSLIAG
jgi:YggT family protein